jgi:hypothetical protein
MAARSANRKIARAFDERHGWPDECDRRFGDER